MADSSRYHRFHILDKEHHRIAQEVAEEVHLHTRTNFASKLNTSVSRTHLEPGVPVEEVRGTTKTKTIAAAAMDWPTRAEEVEEGKALLRSEAGMGIALEELGTEERLEKDLAEEADAGRMDPSQVSYTAIAGGNEGAGVDVDDTMDGLAEADGATEAAEVDDSDNPTLHTLRKSDHSASAVAEEELGTPEDGAKCTPNRDLRRVDPGVAGVEGTATALLPVVAAVAAAAVAEEEREHVRSRAYALRRSEDLNSPQSS